MCRYGSIVQCSSTLWPHQSFLELYRVWLFQIRPEPDLGSTLLALEPQNNTPDETNAVNNAVSKVKVSKCRFAYVKTPVGCQYSSVVPLLRLYLPVFDEICGTAMGFVFLSPE